QSPRSPRTNSAARPRSAAWQLDDASASSGLTQGCPRARSGNQFVRPSVAAAAVATFGQKTNPNKFESDRNTPKACATRDTGQDPSAATGWTAPDQCHAAAAFARRFQSDRYCEHS